MTRLKYGSVITTTAYGMTDILITESFSGEKCSHCESLLNKRSCGRYVFKDYREPIENVVLCMTCIKEEYGK